MLNPVLAQELAGWPCGKREMDSFETVIRGEKRIPSLCGHTHTHTHTE